MANNVNDVAMTWDDEIQNDGEGFRVLPEGEYDFTVTDFTRGRFEGSAKMAACPKAELTITIHDPEPEGDVTVSENLFLNRKAEWKLCQFFTAIGHRKHGETLRMNWNAVKGAKGRCKVGIRKWTGNDGKEREGNEISAFLEPPETTATHQGDAAYTQEPLTSATQPRKWTGGQF
jgi:hypothetical protein